MFVRFRLAQTARASRCAAGVEAPRETRTWPRHVVVFVRLFHVNLLRFVKRRYSNTT
jgi:hypothetical protein